jgi:hypothetical protein
MTVTDDSDRVLVERLHHELGAVAGSVDAPPGLGGRAQRRLRRRRLTKAVAATAIVGLLGSGVAVWRHASDEDDRSRVATDPGESMATTTAPDGASIPPAAEHAVEGRAQTSMLWTGDEIVVWGGQDAAGVHVDGARYDLATQTWRDIPDAPITPAEGNVAVLVDERIVVCCGSTDVGTGPSAAILDLATGEWRSTSPPPFAVRYPGAASASGVALFVGDKAASYDPERDEWRALADPPEGMWAPDVAIDGERLYAWSTPSGGRNFGAEYDPARDEWFELPEPPDDAFPTYADIEPIDGGLAVWGVDRRSFAFPGPGDVGVGAIWDIASRTWKPMAQPLPAAVPYDGNAGSQSMVWNAGTLFVATGALSSAFGTGEPLLLAYDPRTDSWSRLPVALSSSYGAEMVALGDHGIAIMDSSGLIVVPPTTTGEPIAPR